MGFFDFIAKPSKDKNVQKAFLAVDQADKQVLLECLTNGLDKNITRHAEIKDEESGETYVVAPLETLGSRALRNLFASVTIYDERGSQEEQLIKERGKRYDILAFLIRYSAGAENVVMVDDSVDDPVEIFTHLLKNEINEEAFGDISTQDYNASSFLFCMWSVFRHPEKIKGCGPETIEKIPKILRNDGFEKFNQFLENCRVLDTKEKLNQKLKNQKTKKSPKKPRAM